MHFITEYAADFSGQTKVPIVWQLISNRIQSQPISLRWRICPRWGSLQDRGSHRIRGSEPTIPMLTSVEGAT
jgi:hypothetical protein